MAEAEQSASCDNQTLLKVARSNLSTKWYLKFEPEVEDAYEAYEAKARGRGTAILVAVAMCLPIARTIRSFCSIPPPISDSSALLIMSWLALCPVLGYICLKTGHNMTSESRGFSIMTTCFAWALCISMPVTISQETSYFSIMALPVAPMFCCTILRAPWWLCQCMLFSSVGSMHCLQGAHSSLPPVLIAIIAFILYETERGRRDAFVEHLKHFNESRIAAENHQASQASSFNAINHCAKRVMYNSVYYCMHLRTHLASGSEDGYEIHAALDALEADNSAGILKCVSVLQRAQIAAGTFQCAAKPVQLRVHSYEASWSKVPKLSITVSADVPEFVMLPWVLLDIVIDNAMHNATVHGQEGGPVDLCWFVKDHQLVLLLENQAGHNHHEAIRMQENHGQNFFFRQDRNDYQPDWKAKLGCDSSTFLGHGEILDAARLIPAEPQLIFKETSIVFSLLLPLVPSLAPPTTLAEESASELPEGCVLICADDDTAPRAGYRGLVRILKQDKYFILGETYDEAVGLVDFVLATAEMYGDAQVICIFDENMDKYPEGGVKGSKVTKKLRDKKFNGAVFIRSANDDVDSVKKYLAAGADGCFSKGTRPKELAAQLRSQYKLALAVRAQFQSEF